MGRCGGANSRMGGRVTAHPKGLWWASPRHNSSEHRWAAMVEKACFISLIHSFIHSFVHSFIQSFLTPLLLLPETLAEVLRLSEKVKNSLFREGCYFQSPCLSTAATAAFERKAGYWSRVKLLALQGALGPSVGWSLQVEVNCQECWDFFLCSHQAGPRSEQTFLMQLGLEVTAIKPALNLDDLCLPVASALPIS